MTEFRADLPELMAVHDALLRRGTRASHVMVVRSPGLSFGVAVRADRPWLERARREGIPTCRRSSGGTGVLHLAGDLVWAVVLPRTDPRVGNDFVRAYGRLGKGVVAGLSAAGTAARWVDAPALAEEYCPLSSRGQVLEVGGAIAGAAAQHVTSGALLHQGYVSWTVDRPAVDRLFGLATGGPSGRLGGVAGVVGSRTPEHLAVELARELAEDVASPGASA